MAYGILISWPVIELLPPALEVQNLSHQTTREIPFLVILELPQICTMNSFGT